MIPKQKNTFGPKYSNFWVKIAHFHPYRPIGATPVNVFNTKEVSHWFPDIRIPKVKLHPLQKRSFGPKRPNAASKWHLWPNIGIFGPFDRLPDQKTMQTTALVVFCYVGTKTFSYSRKNYDFWPKNGQI